MRRSLAVACGVVLFSAAQAADPSPADRALADAVKVLRHAAEKLPPGRERDRVEAGAVALTFAMEAGETDNARIADLVDNTAAYKGKTVTLRAVYDIADGAPLRDLRGQTARFVATSNDAKVRATFRVDLPAKADVPNAAFGEEVIIAFKCGGSLGGANPLVSARRAK